MDIRILTLLIYLYIDGRDYNKNSHCNPCFIPCSTTIGFLCRVIAIVCPVIAICTIIIFWLKVYKYMHKF